MVAPLIPQRLPPDPKGPEQMTTDDTTHLSAPSQPDDIAAYAKPGWRDRRAYRIANRERRLEYNRAWLAAHPGYMKEYKRAYKAKKCDMINEQSAGYRAANGDKIKAQNAAYRAANKERIKESNRIYNATNREKKAKYERAYRAANMDKMAAKARINCPKRRARKAAVADTFTRADWQSLIASAKRCHWCKKPFSRTNRPTHDHVVPISKGGGNTRENAVAACLRCNLRKHARLINPITGQGILL